METNVEIETSTKEKCVQKVSLISSIDVFITEQILTPATCAMLISEILKTLLYQKSQIPYPYNRLKTTVNKKQTRTENNLEKNFTIDKCFHTASTFYNSAEEIMYGIKDELENHTNNVHEVIIGLGTTTVTPKEVFVIKIPVLAKGHIERNHIHEALKIRHNVLKEIFLSTDWLNAMKNTLPPTNMYIILKKSESITNNVQNKLFVPFNQFSVPSRTKSVTINIRYTDKFSACCSNLNIFQDDSDNLNNYQSVDVNNDQETVEYHYYQAQTTLKGFKDCFINKTSVSELW